MNEKNIQINAFDLPSVETFGIDDVALRKKAASPGGTTCPLCKQHVQIYHRTITAGMAIGLIKIYKYYLSHSLEKSIQIEGYLKRCNVGSTIRGDVAKLQYWGLLRKREGKRDDGSRRNGHYYLTGRGMSFVKMTLKVPKYVTLFNGKMYGNPFGDEIGIAEALGNKFNYDVLMKGEL